MVLNMVLEKLGVFPGDEEGALGNHGVENFQKVQIRLASGTRNNPRKDPVAIYSTKWELGFSSNAKIHKCRVTQLFSKKTKKYLKFKQPFKKQKFLKIV